MQQHENSDITGVIGAIPYRMALAGGWIDQPFMSRLNPTPPGSMVVVGLEPTFRYMTRSGMSTGTRDVAMNLWGGALPNRPPESLVRELYASENADKTEPSGSQDMIGLIYPGVNRLDFDADCEGGVFPKHIESNNDPVIARWIERVFNLLPVAPRPEGYNPLGVKNLDPEWIRQLGCSGSDCYDAILGMDIDGLGASMNACMKCWEVLLPQVVRHPTLTVDLMALLGHYQALYPGAMYSGCGGGYLFVVSEEPVPGALKINVRTTGGSPA